MQRLSSRTTFYNKRVFPIVIVGFVLVFIAVGVIGSHGMPPIGFFLGPAVFVAVTLVFSKYLIFDVVDEVWDAGDALVVRNRGQEERIAFAAISNVSYSRLFNPPRVILSLRTPGLFGDKIVFFGPVRLVAFAPSAQIDDLIKRVESTRPGA